jgi:two-component system response regulator RegA
MSVSHIALIDDDDALCLVLNKALTRLGFVISTARDAETALRLQGLDGALIDLKLGADSGLNLIGPLRAQHPNAMLIVLTGYASIATAVEAMRRGADDYLVKPTDASKIAELFRSAGRLRGTTVAVEPPFVPPSIRRIKWEHLHRVLAEHDGNIARTAKALGVDRSTVYRMLDKRPVRT